jgi:transcriptional regulator with XRE-family HTH domain
MSEERDIRELRAVAENVKRLREAQGWSMSKLARAAGLVPSYISNIEALKAPNPSLQVLDAIARTLGVSLRELLNSVPGPADELEVRGLWEGLDERGREMAGEMMRAWRLKQLVDGRSVPNFPVGDEHRVTQVAA